MSTKIKIGGMATPIAAKPLPVKRPPLDPIRPKAMSPRRKVIPPISTFIQAIEFTTSDSGLSVRGSSIAIKAGIKHIMVKSEKINDASAILLV